MADYAIHDTTLIGTSNIIRKKEGSSALIDPADYPKRINLMGMLQEKTVSGAVASCSDGADAVPVKSWEIEIEPNLNGKSQIIATQTKKNQIDISGTDVDNGYISGRWISSSNSPNTNADWYTTEYLPILPNVEYTLSGIAYGNSPAFCFYDETKTFISGMAYSNRTTITFTSPNNAKYARFSIRNDFTSFMLEFGSTASAYEPYQTPIVSTVNLGQTIYGGQADVVNGTGKVTWGRVVYTGADGENWVSADFSGVYRFRIDNNDVKQPTGARGIVYSSIGTYGSGNDVGTIFSSAYNQNTRIYYIPPQTCTTVEEFKAWLQNNNLDVVYEKATPEDFTFTPISPTPETYLNSNCFWGDTGDSEVVYRSSGTVTPIVPVLTTKSITENGTYSAEDDDADGYSQVTVDVPQGSTIPFEKVWSSGDTGEETFTCAEAGKYLFMVGTSARGTATITSSVTADFTASKQGSDGRGLVIAVYTLAVGDTVTMTNTIVDWVYRTKAVFKISLTLSSVVDSAIVTDGTLSSFSPTFTGNALFIYMAGGRADTNSYDRTYATDNFEWASKMETQTFIRLSYGSDTPTPSLYGYDGGCALAICLQ